MALASHPIEVGSGSLLSITVTSPEISGAAKNFQSSFLMGNFNSYFPGTRLPWIGISWNPHFQSLISLGFQSFSDGNSNFFLEALLGGRFHLTPPPENLSITFWIGPLWFSNPHFQKVTYLGEISLGKKISLQSKNTLFWFPEISLSARTPLSPHHRWVHGYSLLPAQWVWVFD